MKENTSWDGVGKWYDSIVSSQGHYYHTHVVLPGVLQLLGLQKDSHLLDVACGQGVLARHIPDTVSYVGLDLAKELIQRASSYHRQQKTRQFFLRDATKPFNLPNDPQFTHAACILALQNIASCEDVCKHVAEVLKPGASFVFVLNHPCFRIPRQTSWGFDEATKTQYRKINSYMSTQKIPISAHPGKSAESTLSFHLPLSAYFKACTEAGFVIDAVEEWCSDKVSTGKAKTWENRARKEFPLFIAIRAVMTSSCQRKVP